MDENSKSSERKKKRQKGKFNVIKRREVKGEKNVRLLHFINVLNS